MSVQPLRTADLRVVPAQPHVAEPRVAVVLNTNARRVTPKVVHALSHVVPEEDLFLSRSEPDCRRIVQTILERRYATVFAGGGDGTFCALMNEVYRQLETRNRYHFQKPPRFGVLKLGTGNGMASLLHASSLRGDGILDDVLRARAGEVPGYRRLDMLWVDGRRAQFAGLGIDGKLLNDYVWVKDNFAKGALKRALTGAGGYFSSVAFKTVPYCLTHSTSVECEVINGSRSEAQRLGPCGESLGEPIAPGEKIYSGKLMMAAAGTIPFYGLEFRMFPFAARRRGMMHLRLGKVAAPVVLANLPKLWKGRWFPEGIQDFHASEVTIKFARPMPLQIAGDAAGYREEITLAVAREPVEMVDFTGLMH
jgi:diacylglycerol kinase family enzyme